LGKNKVWEEEEEEKSTKERRRRKALNGNGKGSR
jgi:hypothetical protein